MVDRQKNKEQKGDCHISLLIDRGNDTIVELIDNCQTDIADFEWLSYESIQRQTHTDETNYVTSSANAEGYH